MGNPAYIIMAGAPSAESRTGMLENAGYRCRVLSPDEDAVSIIVTDNPNVVFVGAADEAGREVIRSLKADSASRRIPVVAVDVGDSPDALRTCYEAGADDIFEEDAEDSEILARMISLVRLSAMETELLRRAGTAGEFGRNIATELDVSLNTTGFSLLVTGVSEDEFEAMCPLLSQTELNFEVERDPYRARNRIEDDQGAQFAGALVYVKAGDESEKGRYFCQSIRNDRRLFDLPLFVVAEEGAFGDLAEAYGHGANVVVHTPIDCDFVDVHMRMLLRGRALRRVLGKRIAEALGPESADQLGSVYSTDFVESHINRLARDGSESGRASSAVLFFVPTIGEVAALYGSEGAAMLRQQIADWLSSLVRVEDVVARAGADEFLVVLPETSAEDADAVRKRVIGVLHQSEFRLTDNVPVGVDIYVQSGLTTIGGTDNLENLVERTSSSLE